MKIALICLARPETGTGNGTTEYSYQLYTRLKRISGNKVDLYYGIKKSMRYDVTGFMKMQVMFPRELAKLAKKKYDVIHITIQELGFAARILKKSGSRARIITTVHDLARLDDNLYKGLIQKSYNGVVRRSINDAMHYSDFILFNSSQTESDTIARFGKLDNSKVVWHGTRGKFFEPNPEKRKSPGYFVTGYIGALGTHKNVISVLKIAKLLKRKDKFKFLIYGTGLEHRRIERFRKENGLNNVYLMGFVKESKIVHAYDNLDAFIMPSLYEGLSHQILEAQARGVPVIVYKRARIPDKLTTHCFRARNESDAARIIQGLASSGYNQARRRGDMAFSRGFTWDKTAAETYAVYKTLLE